MEVQTSLVELPTDTEVQNDIGMESQIVYFRFISLFGNHFTKIHYTFDENISLSRKMVQNIIKTTILAVWYFLLLLPWQKCANLKIAISFERSFVPQIQSIVSDIKLLLLTHFSHKYHVRYFLTSRICELSNQPT